MGRNVPVYLSDRLNAGAANLAELIKVRPRYDTNFFGFTDYEEDLTVDGQLYLSRPGIKMNKAQSTMMLNVDNSEGQGIIGGPMTADLLFSGELEGAEFERAICDYAVIKGYDTGATAGAGQDRVILMTGYVGRVVVNDKGYSVELRSKSQLLQQNVGEVVSATCRVRRLFDERCRANPAGVGYPNPDPVTGVPPTGGSAGPWNYYVDGSVTGIINEIEFSATLATNTYPNGWFRHGILTWKSGLDVGYEVDVADDVVGGGGRVIKLVSPEGYPIQVGWEFELEAGCDRTHITCDVKFQNTYHYQGEPWIIGDTEFYKLP